MTFTAKNVRKPPNHNSKSERIRNSEIHWLTNCGALEIFGGCGDFLHQGIMPENESDREETREIPNELKTITNRLFRTNLSPACRPSSKLSWGWFAPAIPPEMAPPTMQMPKYKATNRKTNSAIEVKTRFRGIICLVPLLEPPAADPSPTPWETSGASVIAKAMPISRARSSP